MWRRWKDALQESPQTTQTEAPQEASRESSSNDPPTKETKSTEVVDPRVQLRLDSRALGSKTARKSGALAAVVATLAALRGEATAMALALHESLSEADQERKRRSYETLEQRLERQLEKRDRAKVRVQETRRAWAEMGPEKPRPTVSVLLRHAAVLGLMLSIAPTFHDLGVGLDPAMRWLAGGLAAWGLSLFIILGLMPSNSDFAGSPEASEDMSANPEHQEQIQ